MLFAVLMAVYTYGGELKPNVDQTVEQLCSRIENLYTEERLNDREFDLRKDIDSRQLCLDIRFSKQKDSRDVFAKAIISKIELI